MEANTIETTAATVAAPARLAAGWISLVCGVVCWAIWFVWRLDHLAFHPVAIIMLLIEVSGVVAGTMVGLGLLRAEAPRAVLPTDRRDSHRYAYAVADRTGRTRTDDLQGDLLAAIERVTTRSVNGRADRAMIGVLIDGPRRIATVAVLSLALMTGAAPMSMPPMWAVAAVAASTLMIASSHVLATSGRIRIGDRTRWSFAALGEVCSRADHAAVAPRRWVGTIGTIVLLNVAGALRGMSDRWTHGLPAMTDDQRLVTMGWAVAIVLGGLFTLRTMDPPNPSNGHVVSRRLEEQAARRSALRARQRTRRLGASRGRSVVCRRGPASAGRRSIRSARAGGAASVSSARASRRRVAPTVRCL